VPLKLGSLVLVSAGQGTTGTDTAGPDTVAGRDTAGPETAAGPGAGSSSSALLKMMMGDGRAVTSSAN
jgi:hypothetical protein